MRPMREPSDDDRQKALCAKIDRLTQEAVQAIERARTSEGRITTEDAQELARWFSR